MATFELTTPDGQTLEVDAVDIGAAQKAVAHAFGGSAGAAAAAAPAQPGQWELFKAGLSAIAQDPSKLLNIGPLKGVQEGGELVRAATEGQLPALPSDYTPAQSD